MPTVAVTVELNWRAARHYAEELKSCRVCKSPTHQRDGAGLPCDNRCAVQEAEQELLALAAAYFAYLDGGSATVEHPQDVVGVAEPVPAWSRFHPAPDQRRRLPSWVHWPRGARLLDREEPVDGGPVAAEDQGDVGGQQPRLVAAGAQ
jgi:hypothetical protein